MEKDILPDGLLSAAPEALEDFLACSESVGFKKNDVVERQDSRQDYLYIVHEGILRVSRICNSNETTIRFLFPGDTQLSLCDFQNTGINPFSYIAITDCSVLRIPNSRLKTLVKRHNSIALWFGDELVNVLAKLERRFVYLGGEEATKTYGNLCKSRPEIITEIPPKYVAQYLNIRLETYYRLRTKLIRR